MRILLSIFVLAMIPATIFAQRPRGNNPQGMREMPSMGRSGMMSGGGMMPFGGMDVLRQFDVEFATEVPQEQDGQQR